MVNDQRDIDLQKIRSIANYQFGFCVGSTLFPDEVQCTHSRKTGKIKHVYHKGQLLATLRPRTGLFSLTLLGAERLKSIVPPLRFRVIVEKEVEDFVKKGRNVLARHIVKVDRELRPGSEVIVTDNGDSIIAVGTAFLSGPEMLAFKRGVAVKNRQGILKGR